MPILELLDFSSLFVYSARSFIDEGPGLNSSIFTSRQSQAISSLGTARILRTRQALDLKDLVELAVITSPPRAQKYAEMIAFRILLGDERELFTSIKQRKHQPIQEEQESTSGVNQSQNIWGLDLNHIMRLLNLENSVNQDNSHIIDYLNQLENSLFHNTPNSSSMNNLAWAQIRTAFDIVGGRQGILNNQITSDQQLLQKAKTELTRQIPVMAEDQLVDATILDMLDKIEKLSNEESIKQLIRQIEAIQSEEGTKIGQIREELENMSHKELEMLDQLSSLLEKKGNQLHLNNTEYLPSLQEFRECVLDYQRTQVYNLDDIINKPQLFNSGLDYDEMEEIVDNSISLMPNPLELMQKATEIDDILHTNFSDKISQKLQKEFDDLTIDELLEKPSSHSEWLNQVQKRLDDTDATSWDDMWENAQKLERAKDNTSNLYLRKELEEFAHDTLNNQITSSKSPDQLEQSVEWAKEREIAHSKIKVKEKAQELGMNAEQIAKLIGDAYEIIKMMIEEEDPSFERMNSILPHADLTHGEKSKLIDTSIQQEATGAFAGFLQHSFSQAMDQIGNSQKDQELMREAIGAGAGENLLKEWYLHGNNMPPWMREMVKQIAKQILIDQGKKRASMLLGSSEAGPLPEGSIRPYNLGDDPDTIDLEETVENILSLGKSVDQVRADDLIVRKTVTGRRCVIFLIDISGSMSGQPLASAAMATVMLLYAFSRDELGIALFESSTHVICEINQPVDIDEIADEILDLTARGGTQMQAALEWAEGQFGKSRSEDKMFLMITDAMIGDFNRSSQHMKNIADQGATSVLCVPSSGYGLGSIQNIVSAANSQLITVRDWKEFPEQISEILNRS